MKPISQQVRDNIISLLDNGFSSRQIAMQLRVGHSTVNRVRRTNRAGVQKPRAGRPVKLSASDKRWLVRTVTSGKADTASQLTQELRHTACMDISTETVRRSLKEAGMKAVSKIKKPRLLLRHRRQRMDFAILYKDWTVDDWSRVVWSDETKINRLGSDGRAWVWKRHDKTLTDQHVKGTVKYGGGNLMMWGCMTAQGVGHACRIDGRMDAALYVSILDDELEQTLEYYRLDRYEIIFQQDNDAKHTSKLARNWFNEKEIRLLEWPAQSPDLNPIEHLWQHLKRQLAMYENEPAGIHELWERVEDEWSKIPVQVCIDLINSMPRRVAAVLKAKGGHTKY